MAESKWKILWVKSGPLHPPDTGGKIRTLQMLREISRRHEVTYLSLKPAHEPLHDDEDRDSYAAKKVWIEHEQAPRRSLKFFAQLAGNALSSKPYALSRYYSSACRDELLTLNEAGLFDLIVSDFLPPAQHFTGWHRRTPTVLFQHNMESQIWKRMAANHSSRWARMYFSLQHRRMLRWEKLLSARFDGVITVSPEDSRFAREHYGLMNVLGEVPPGVDTEFFRPSINEKMISPRLAFLGSMDWLPNGEGALWFAREVLPRIRESVPEAKLRIIGRRPATEVRRLAEQDENIEVTGTVDDVRPWLADCAAMVVPLLSGGGTRIKILEAMAQGLAVISTTVGAEGLPFENGKHLMLADDPASLAEVCVRLMNDAAKRDLLAMAARDEVVARYSWAAAAEKFCTLCERVRRL